MARRKMTYRLHDFGRITVGLDPSGYAGTFYPIAFAFLRSPKWRGYDVSRSRQLFRIVLPHLPFRWAYRLRMLWFYRLIQRFYFSVGEGV